MTPEEEARARAREIAQGYPEEIHFIGGPYCGSILRPHVELITDVHRQMDIAQIPHSILAPNFFPATPHTVVLSGALGHAVYELGEDLRWTFQGYVSEDGGDESE